MFDYIFYIVGAYGVWFVLGFGLSYYSWQCYRSAVLRLRRLRGD